MVFTGVSQAPKQGVVWYGETDQLFSYTELKYAVTDQLLPLRSPAEMGRKPEYRSKPLTASFRNLKARVYMILWFNYNVMDMFNLAMFYLVTIFDITNEFLPGDNKTY